MPTQKERFAEVLQKLRPDITEIDRNDALETLHLSKTLLSMYLNAKGTNNDTAAMLIKFFKERIAERDRIALEGLPLETKKPEEVLSG